MKLSPAQFATLHTLAQYGAKQAVEVHGPRGMDGKRKVTLQWNVANAVTLAKLEDAKLVTVARDEGERPVSAIGKRGHRRVNLVIAINDAGRAALAAT